MTHADDGFREKQSLLLKDIGSEWAAIRAALDACEPDVSLHDPENAAWNSRDVFAHLARWLTESHLAIERHVQGLSHGYADEDSERRNAAWQAEDSSIELGEARGRAERAVGSLTALLESLTPAQWDGLIYRHTNGNGPAHFRQHLDFLRKSGVLPD